MEWVFGSERVRDSIEISIAASDPSKGSTVPIWSQVHTSMPSTVTPLFQLYCRTLATSCADS